MGLLEFIMPYFNIILSNTFLDPNSCCFLLRYGKYNLVLINKEF